MNDIVRLIKKMADDPKKKVPNQNPDLPPNMRQRVTPAPVAPPAPIAPNEAPAPEGSYPSFIKQPVVNPQQSVAPSGGSAPSDAGPPIGSAPSDAGPAPGNTQKGTSTNVGISSSPAVKEMQQAIKTFATAVSSYSATKESNLGVSGRKPFNDFITEQYLANSDVKGVEWSKDPTVISQKQKSPTTTPLTEMEYVINSFERIGASKNEVMNDGRWDFRTNNALQNIYAFADALIKLAKDFKIQLNVSFDDNDLSNLDKNTPTNEHLKDISRKDPKKISIVAKNLTVLITKLTAFYNAYVIQIAKNPQFKSYIEGAALININTKPQASVKTPKENQLLQQPNQFVQIKQLPNSSGQQVPMQAPIPLSAFSSKESLDKILEQLGYKPTEITNELRIKYIGLMIEDIKQYLSIVGYKPEDDYKGTEAAIQQNQSQQTNKAKSTTDIMNENKATEVDKQDLSNNPYNIQQARGGFSNKNIASSIINNLIKTHLR